MRLRLGLLGIALWIPTAQAAEPPPPSSPSPTFEVTPFAGFNMGGRFRLDDSTGSGGITGHDADLDDRGAFAFALDARLDEGTQYELFYGRESSVLRGDATFAPARITVEYLHLGGTVLLDDDFVLKPYILGGVGATRFSPPAEGNTDTRFSASLGVGLRLPVNRHFSVRLEARGFVTLVNSDAAIFCQSDQTGLLCRIHGSGGTFFQGEVLAGAAFAF
jgi:hypothetical protein